MKIEIGENLVIFLKGLAVLICFTVLGVVFLVNFLNF